MSKTDSHRSERISLCMITRDEVDYLPQCLESAKALVDEIVIVDTGSTDGTLGIAAAYGAKVFEHPWEEDYSKHRNLSIAYASGDWILILDADEVISPRDTGRIRSAIDSSEADGLMFTLRNYENDCNLANLTMNPDDYEEGRGYPGFIKQDLIRAFRNRPDTYFTGKVHETVTRCFQQSKKIVYTTGIPIHHYGKVRRDRASQKRETYLKLGQDRVRDNPQDPMAYKGLSDQYLESGMADEALEIAGQGLESFPEMVGLRFNRGLALDRLKNREEACGEYEWVLARRPDHVGACHNLVQIYLSENRVSEAIEVLDRGIALGMHHPAIYVLQGRAYQAMGDEDGALTSFDRALDSKGDYPNANCHRAVILLKKGMYGPAIEALEREVEIDGNIAGAYTLLGQISHELKDPENAVQFFRKVLAFRPGDPIATDYLQQHSGT